jgi:hypothetical protein
MTLFPWLVLLLLLAALAVLLIVASTATTRVARRRRPFVARPRLRVVAVVLLVELAALLLWALVLRPV